MNLDDLTLKELLELSREPVKCKFLEKCEYKKYASCYNHSHVICEHYEIYYEKDKFI